MNSHSSTDGELVEDHSHPSGSRHVSSQQMVRLALPPKQPVLEDYGNAVYMAGRMKKNPVMVYQSRVHKNRVYEFCLVRHFTKPVGYSTWMCSHCAVMRQKARKEGIYINHKLPRILVDNDVIREDPDHPIHPHFCNGKNVVEAAASRVRLQVLQECEAAVSASSCMPGVATTVRLMQAPDSEEYNFLAPDQRRAVKRRLQGLNADVLKKKVSRVARDHTSKGAHPGAVLVLHDHTQAVRIEEETVEVEDDEEGGNRHESSGEEVDDHRDEDHPVNHEEEEEGDEEIDVVQVEDLD